MWKYSRIDFINFKKNNPTTWKPQNNKWKERKYVKLKISVIEKGRTADPSITGLERWYEL